MKKILVSLTIVIAFLSALIWGYVWLLNEYIPSLIFSENPVGKEVILISETEENADEQPDEPLAEKQAGPAVSAHKTVVKLLPEDSVSDVLVSGEPAPPPDTFDGIVAEILERSQNLEKEITVDIKGFSDKEIADALLDSGKYYYISWTGTSGITGATITITPKYRIAEEIFYAQRTGSTDGLSYKAQAAYDIARKVIDEKIREGMSDYEKALAIHDYLVLNSKYDAEAAKLVNAGRKDFSDKEDSFTAFGLLFNKRGVCQAYSEAFNIFMSMLGIDCEEVTGEAGGEPHAWNRIMLDGDFYHIDATWDDPLPDSPGEVSRAYFCITDDMLAKDHTWEKDDKDSASLKYNYFELNGLVVKNQSDFDRVISDAYKNGETYAEMKLLGFDINGASLGNVAELTGMSSFRFTEGGKQNVIKFYLK